MLTLALALVATAAPPKLAMPEWSRVDVTPELGAFYADHLAGALRQKGLGVVTAQEIASVLGVERQRELLGCADSGTSCMAELGNALGCDGVIKVSVAKLEGTVRANISVLSSVDGSVKVETSVAADGQEKFFSALDEAAGLLAQKLKPPPVMTGGRIRSFSWMPAAAFGVSFALGIVAEVLARVTYNQLDTATSYGQASTLATNGSNAQAFGAVMFAVSGACAVTTALMYFLGGPTEVVPSVEVAPGGARASVLLHW